EGNGLGRNLDTNLVNHALGVRADLVVALGNDRDVVDLVEQLSPEQFDLRRRRLAAQEETEVDPQIEHGRLTFRGGEYEHRFGVEEGGAVLHLRARVPEHPELSNR